VPQGLVASVAVLGVFSKVRDRCRLGEWANGCCVRPCFSATRTWVRFRRVRRSHAVWNRSVAGMNATAMRPKKDALDGVHAYHQRTKHAFGHYARGPGYLDWDTQPDPFRRFSGPPAVPLALSGGQQPTAYADLFQPAQVSPRSLHRESLGVLLELAFGLSAWKQHGSDRWALRCNPSSGNLHPTEAYAIVSGVKDLDAGVYHYVSHDHALEQRCRAELPFQGLLVALSSIHWREAWKYGERAFRYCQHDVGHALGALRYAAAVLGWRLRLLDDWSDEEIAGLLGLERRGDFIGAEEESPDLICLVEPALGMQPAALDRLEDAAHGGEWLGRANALSVRHQHCWPEIEEVARATRKPRTAPANWRPEPPVPLLRTGSELRAADIIKQRRSAQAFDGVTSIPSRVLLRMLDATLPRANVPPLDAWPWPPRVHLLLFVHRVEGLRPGLYLFCRRREALDELGRSFRRDFAWEAVTGCPEHFRFYRLVQANVREVAKMLSCHQDIAADGAFSLGMLAEFAQALEEGPWVYRRLFWECGLIGQVLYLEAEAAGVRGTGIGCFFDDPVHDLLGISSTRFQSLYHFTVGGPIMDGRLQTLPAYAHLQR
jgi:nitroreductase